jgi:hypothetical protein
MALVKVSEQVRERLLAMRDGKQVALGRVVTLGEIVEDLLAGHDAYLALLAKERA